MAEIKLNHTGGSPELEEVLLGGDDNSLTLKSDDPKLNFTGFSILDGASAGFTADVDGARMVVQEKSTRPGKYRYKVRYAYDGESFERDGRFSRMAAASGPSPKDGEEGGG